jgi:hypothetical protein
MDCDAGEDERLVVACIGGCVASNDNVMPFQLFRKYVGIEKNLDHLEIRNWDGRSAAFFVGELDYLIQQSGVFLAAKQSQPVFKDGRSGWGFFEGVV